MTLKETEIRPNTPYSKIVEYGAVPKITRHFQGLGLKVVLTTGIYDLFHFKHAESLACISLLGDVTIVGIPGDSEIAAAGAEGKQNKDQDGPIVAFDKRAKMVAHLPYVNFIFKKTSDKFGLIRNIQPDILAQSITSGPRVISEILEIAKRCTFRIVDGNLTFNTNGGTCTIIFIDDVVNGKTEIIPIDDVLEKAKVWEASRFSKDKFHGSLIKQEIVKRLGEKEIAP